jgi:hypothetical protein
LPTTLLAKLLGARKLGGIIVVDGSGEGTPVGTRLVGLLEGESIELLDKSAEEATGDGLVDGSRVELLDGGVVCKEKWKMENSSWTVSRNEQQTLEDWDWSRGAGRTSARRKQQ